MAGTTKRLTNREYLHKALAGLRVKDDDIDLILLKAGLRGEAEADARACDLATYNRFSVVLKAGLYNVSEGGYSLSWNIEAVKLYYTALCNELGLEDVLTTKRPPRVRNRSNRW